MLDIQGKTVLITGASSGIGEATARHLARLGASVLLGARRGNRLDALAKELTQAGHAATAAPLDVTDLDAVRAFVDVAVKKYGRVDVMINNAGVMPLSKLEALKVDEWNRMIDVNIRGVLNGIAAALPVFKRQGFGQFVNLSSIGGHSVVPTSAVYSATKFAVLAISEGLRLENDNIRVTVISPGVTTSELAESISDPTAKKAMEDFRKGAIPAEAVARAIAFSISQPADVDVSEIIVRPTASPY